jgi:predicted rRNA methylase YqxC with S4 and FtsJ domains
LHPKVAADPRVVSLEATDARDLTPALIPQPPGLIVCDVSFISLAKALPAALALAEPGADLVALVKPQFESDPARVGKGGLVTDPRRASRPSGRRGLRHRRRLDVLATEESPIEGGDGDRELPALGEAASPQEQGAAPKGGPGPGTRLEKLEFSRRRRSGRVASRQTRTKRVWVRPSGM